jgi:ferredoxin-NADP reductase
MNPDQTPAKPEVHIEQLTLQERRHEYDDVYTYIFSAEHPIEFVAGQYTHIRLPNLPEGTKRARELSFASAPSDPLLWFGIDSRSESAYQQALLALKIGDVVEQFKTKGHMTWPPPTSDVVMIAGGVGVTPFRSMLLDARDKNLSVATTLVQVASAEYMYADELKSLVQEHVTIHRGDLADTLARVTSEHSGAHYYLAGSSTFVQAVAATLSSKGITRIESDEFKGLVDQV